MGKLTYNFGLTSPSFPLTQKIPFRDGLILFIFFMFSSAVLFDFCVCLLRGDLASANNTTERIPKFMFKKTPPPSLPALSSSSDVRYLEFGVTCKLDVGRICPIERGQLEKMMSCNQHSNSVSEIKKFLQTSLFVLSRSTSSHINMKIMQN